MKRVKQLSGRTAEEICLAAGLCSGPTKNTYSAPQTHGWWRGERCQRTRTPLMPLLASDLWINACSIINLALTLSTIDYKVKTCVEKLQDDNLLIKTSHRSDW